mgnify:CR=1 FL=1
MFVSLLNGFCLAKSTMVIKSGQINFTSQEIIFFEITFSDLSINSPAS